MTAQLKAVLFDIDDTLFDREAAQRLSLDLTIEKYFDLLGGIPREKLEQAWVESDLMTVPEFNAGSFDRGSRSRHFLRLLNLPPDLADDLTQLYLLNYPNLKVPVEGALELIQLLRPYFKVGVISNSYPDVQYGKLKTLGLKEILECIVLSEEYGIRKPDPRIFKHAASLLRVEVTECLFVGDSLAADVIGAKSAGMLSCWFQRGKSLDKKEVNADFVITRLSQLLPLIKPAGLSE